MEEWKNQLPKNQPPPYNREGNNQDSQKPQESPQGSEKRQSGDNVQQFPGVAEGGYPNRIKRPCLQDLTLSVGLVAHPSTSSANMEAPPMMINPGAPAAAAAGHAFLFESNPMTSVPMESPFVVPQAAAVDLRNPTVSYYDRANSMPSTVPVVDEEIHDLLEELTKIHRSSNSEHNLEKILRNKPEDPPALNQLPEDLSLSARPSAHVPHGANPSSSQAPGVSLPVPLSSSGVSYNMASTSNQMASSGSSTAQARNQSQMMLAAAVPPPQVNQWHHANQLKALAANKRGSTTKQQGPPPAWSGLPAPGVSPPFHPVPSPYPLPMFNTQSLSGMSSSNLPATSLQGTPNAVLPGMVTSNSTALVPYVSERLPSPALNQQSPFSPQSSILANLVSSNIRNPPRHRMANMPTSNPRHSYPYRPPRPSSGLPQQSFAPQGSMLRSLPPTGVPLGPQQPLQQQQQSHVVFNKPPANNSSRSLRLVMQQGMASSSSGMPDPFTFGNTRPLSHFASGPRPQRMPSVPTTPRPPSLLQYLQQPMLTQASSASASSTTTATLQSDHSTVFMQQMMQQTQGPAPPLSTDPRQSISTQGHQLYQREHEGLSASDTEAAAHPSRSILFSSAGHDVWPTWSTRACDFQQA
ncbi:PREDICTED: mastermind-like domain-containing protein 1 [Elephantulus edwardii]|uniref:mastermind-like domain-containing protein 1 n=1 Tax=Elephantulus edwardii TaxID=28737 RepID=UPI0003F079C3|nr:PREDICTED: mastermind-like domain-containing protein 1 [Elephantulus edwardii]